MAWWVWFPCVNDHSPHSCSHKYISYTKVKDCGCRSCEKNLLWSLSLPLVARGFVWLMSNTFSYQVWYEWSRAGSGSSISHTSGKALPDSRAVSLLLLPRLVTPSHPALPLAGGADRREYWEFLPAGASERLDHPAGLRQREASLVPLWASFPIKEKGSGTWTRVLAAYTQGDGQNRSPEAIMSLPFVSIHSTRGKTPSQGNLYQRKADSMLETFSADMLVCQGHVPLRLLLRRRFSGAHPRSHLSSLSSQLTFSLLLSITPGKQTRRTLHIHGRPISPVVLSADARNISGPRHHSYFWISPKHLWSTNKYELGPGASLH